MYINAYCSRGNIYLTRFITFPFTPETKRLNEKSRDVLYLMGERKKKRYLKCFKEFDFKHVSLQDKSLQKVFCVILCSRLHLISCFEKDATNANLRIDSRRSWGFSKEQRWSIAQSEKLSLVNTYLFHFKEEKINRGLSASVIDHGFTSGL